MNIPIILGYYATVTRGHLPLFHRSTMHSKYWKLGSHLPVSVTNAQTSKIHPITFGTRHRDFWTPPAQSTVL